MRPPTRRARLLLLPLCLAAVLAACSGGGGTVAASKESGPRPPAPADPATAGDPSTDGVGDPTTDGVGDGADRAFCAALADLAHRQGPALGNDPAAAVEALATLGDRAPAGLRDDVATLRSVVGELAALDGSDPASVDRALGIVLRPEVLAASEAIDTYAKQRCGVDLGMTSGDAESPGSSGMDAAATGSGDIDLEDVDAVRTANGSASWSDKLTSTTILNDTDVTLAADDASALTADEALAACRAVRAALVAINSRVVVTIRSGGTAVAVAPADGECAPA